MALESASGDARWIICSEDAPRIEHAIALMLSNTPHGEVQTIKNPASDWALLTY